MKRRSLAVLIAGLLLWCSLFPGWSEAQTEPSPRPDLVIGYTPKAFTDVDVKDADAAMNIYAKELARQVGHTAESRAFDNNEAIVADLQKGKLDFVSFSTLDYLRVKNRIDAGLALGHVKGGKIGSRFLILVNRRQGFTKIGDLRNKRVALPKGDDIGMLFLDTTVLREMHTDVKKFFSSILEKPKATQAVLGVFFSQADACVVTDVAFKTMIEMNPQLEKDLKIIASSKELTITVTVMRRGLNEDIKRKTLDVGLTLKSNPRGRQVLLLFKIEELKRLQESDLANVKELVVEHDRLKAARR